MMFTVCNLQSGDQYLLNANAAMEAMALVLLENYIAVPRIEYAECMSKADYSVMAQHPIPSGPWLFRIDRKIN